jgi:hypothetical protein
MFHRFRIEFAGQFENILQHRQYLPAWRIESASAKAHNQGQIALPEVAKSLGVRR